MNSVVLRMAAYACERSNCEAVRGNFLSLSPDMLQAARTLLTLDEKETKRLFEGEALLRRMYKYGLLDESQSKLDYVLAMTPQDFLERRLQTLVFKLGLAKSMHHARVLIRQRHIRYAPNPRVLRWLTIR